MAEGSGKTVRAREQGGMSAGRQCLLRDREAASMKSQPYGSLKMICKMITKGGLPKCPCGWWKPHSTTPSPP